VSNRIRTAYINNINALKKAGCSELGAKMAADMLLDKEAIVEENQKLKAENERLRAIIENIQIESEKLNDYNLVHRVKSLQNIIALYYLKIKKEVSE